MKALHKRGAVDYFSLEGVRQSELKELARSPKSYRHWQENAKADRDTWRVGRLGHTAVLEPMRLTDYAVWETTGNDGKKRQRRGKHWEMFQAAHLDKTIVKDTDIETIRGAAAAVRADEVAMQYLGAGMAETALQWRDATTGTLCKTLVDWIHGHGKSSPVLVELKFTAGPVGGFERIAANLNYHWQCAWHVDGYEAVTGVAPRVKIVAVELSPPHDVVVYDVPDDVLDIARDEYRTQLERLEECRASGEWPGAAGGVEKVFQLPAWKLPKDDDIDDWSSMGLVAEG